MTDKQVRLQKIKSLKEATHTINKRVKKSSEISAYFCWKETFNINMKLTTKNNIHENSNSKLVVIIKIDILNQN